MASPLMKTQIIFYGRQLQNSEGLKVNGSCTRSIVENINTFTEHLHDTFQERSLLFTKTTGILTIIIKYFTIKRNIAQVLMIVELDKR